MPNAIPPISNGDYFREAVFNPKLTLDLAQERLKGVEFDTIIGTGMSGGIIIPLLANRMHKHFALIRKDRDGSHSGSPFVGNIGHRFIFVDDFISTGATFWRVIDRMDRIANDYERHVEYVGTYTYQNSSLRDGWHPGYNPDGPVGRKIPRYLQAP